MFHSLSSTNPTLTGQLPSIKIKMQAGGYGLKIDILAQSLPSLPCLERRAANLSNRVPASSREGT